MEFVYKAFNMAMVAKTSRDRNVEVLDSFANKPEFTGLPAKTDCFLVVLFSLFSDLIEVA